jgi:membrane protease YdiL (CAAX protease family)
MTGPRMQHVWRILLIAATIFAVMMALLPHPPGVAEVGDKYQHMLAFGTLTILYALAFPTTPLLRIGERLSFLGALVEVFQSIPALHRDCDVMDWIADTFIIVVVLIVIRLGRGRRGGAL